MATLLPQEQELARVFKAEKRRADFIAGRQAARAALKALGLAGHDSAPVLQGQQREPLWPPGVVGTVAHGSGWAVAAVAAATRYSGLGIDIESAERAISPNVAGRFCVPSEAEWIFDEGEFHPERALMLFTAKEAIYKAYYPICRRYFGFEAVLLSWNQAIRAFEGELLIELCPTLPKSHRFIVGSKIENSLAYSWLSIPKPI